MTEAKPTIESVTKTTPDLLAEQVEKLKALFPEVVSEGRVDFDRLRATLGDLDALADEDGYTFTWAGKEEAFRAIQTPSAASLQPAPEESVAWETTKHLFVEGENLEVLKLLYKSYVGKVKMIYIDPPYNTGNDFIYKDDYREPLRAYLEKTGQVDAEGNVLTSNPETRGRYHSDWLTMMYPRLFLARQLLREDGVIFVSIDDNEVHHLRLLMNEIFGEENFVANVVWQKKYSPQNDARWLSDMHDHILLYARDKDSWRPTLLPRTKEQNAAYKNPDDDPRGRWKAENPTSNKTRLQRPNLYYAITNPYSGEEVWPQENRVWALSRDRFEEMEADDRIWWGADGTNSVPALKRFLSEVRQGRVPTTVWTFDEVGHNQIGRQEVNELLGSSQFDTPKPTTLIQRILRIGTDPNDDDIVMDFFAGSGTTAHSVLDMNQRDGGARRFILVQIPEETGYRDFATIADIAKERVRRVITRMSALDEAEVSSGSNDHPQLTLELSASGGPVTSDSASPVDEDDYGEDPASGYRPSDLGFKVFKLASSSFRTWTSPEDAEAAALERQLSFFDEGLKDDVNPQHALYEIILKEGYSLNSEIEPLTVGANTVYRITDEPFRGPAPEDGDDGMEPEPASFYLCLDDEIAPGILAGLALDEEMVFVCQDAALDDSQKVNLSLQCVLKTV